MKTAIIVVGHGGIKHDPGAVNKNITEFGWCDNFIQKHLKPELIKNNIKFKVVYRRDYKSLPMDINQISDVSDFVLSFHCNAADNPKATGTETLFYEGSKKGELLAKIINTNIVDALGLRDRGIKYKSREDRGAYLLRKTKAPCVILESFFISNDRDLEIATSRQEALAQNIVKAIKEYKAEVTK